MSLTREFIAERDSRIFQMRKQGISIQEIARRVGITVPAVNASIQRMLAKLSGEALMAYPHLLQMELERLDALLSSAWPLTQHRMVTLDDGTKIAMDPDVKFIQEARGIIKDRIKLLGLEQTTVNIQQSQPEPIRHSIPQVIEITTVDAHDPEEEARKMIEIMRKAGILSDTDQLALGVGNDDE